MSSAKCQPFCLILNVLTTLVGCSYFACAMNHHIDGLMQKYITLLLTHCSCVSFAISHHLSSFDVHIALVAITGTAKLALLSFSQVTRT